MAFDFSGNAGVVTALKEFGVSPKWCMGQWLGPWTNQAQIDNHIAWCKANGVLPAFQFFYWGDEICVEALKGTFSPKEYGGKSESIGEYWTLAKLLVGRLKATSTVGALVSIESEWNKLGPNLPNNMGLHGIPDEPAVFDKLFADTAGLLHQAPGTKVVTCPGSWTDLVALLAKFPLMVAATDYVATQSLNTTFGQTAASYVASGDRLLKKMGELKVGGKGKPILVMDCAWSSYAGSYGSKDSGRYAPIPPATVESNLKAGEDLQRQALEHLVALMPQLEAAGLKGMFYRGLKDSRMAIANYWGYFEWGWGVVRLDGTRKPSYNALMRLATPTATSIPAPSPAPVTYTRAQYDEVVSKIDAAQDATKQALLERDQARTDAATAKNDLAAANAARTALLDKIRRADAVLHEP